MAVAAPSSTERDRATSRRRRPRTRWRSRDGVDDVEHVVGRDLRGGHRAREPGDDAERRRATGRPRDGRRERRRARARTASIALRRFGSRSSPSRPATEGASLVGVDEHHGLPAGGERSRQRHGHLGDTTAARAGDHDQRPQTPVARGARVGNGVGRRHRSRGTPRCRGRPSASTNSAIGESPAIVASTPRARR